ERRGVVHDRSAAGISRSGEVVFETERVPDLVRGELAYARERHLCGVGRRVERDEIIVVGQRAEVARAGAQRVGRTTVILLSGERRNQSTAEQIILSDAERAERDVAFDDLAGARVVDVV